MKAHKALELQKVLNRLSEMAVCTLTKERALKTEPSSNANEVERLLMETDEAFRMMIKKSAPPISPCTDIRGAIKRAQISAVLNPKELLNVAHVLRVTRGIESYTSEKDFNINFPILNLLRDRITLLRSVEEAVFAAILSEDEIADDASPALSSIRRKSKALGNKIRDVLSDMIKSTKYQKALQESFVTMRGDRYVLPVKAEHKSEVSGVVHDLSSSGQTLFIEPMAVVEINNEIRRLAAEESDEIERILAELSEQVSNHAEAILENFMALIDFDFAFAKGKLAYDMNAIMPKMNTKGIIDIKKGRHPLIDKKAVVPIDIYLGGEFDTLVITGPNTGGKTVALKTLGLFTLMAQSGLLVPAGSDTKMAVFGKVFADIGDEQSIEQSLSTFSSHMVNIVGILKEADDNSLILFDELGAGTDPTEGAALAVAILEYVKTSGAKTAATTHYSEIKIYALTMNRVENAACEFDLGSLRPTYKLLIGVPGKSNAFAISSRLGLSDYIIDRAREQLTAENVQFEDLISDLEKNRSEAETSKDEAQKYKREAEQVKIEIQRQKKELESQKQKLMDDARKEAKKVIENAKRETEQLIKELKEAAEEKDMAERQKAFENARQSLNKKKDALDDGISSAFINGKKPTNTPKNLRLGQTVEISTLEQKGTVLTLPDSKGNLQIQSGIFKVTTHISTISAVEETSSKDAAKKYSQKITMGGRQIKPEVDVRGQNLEEAEDNVRKFLDDAMLSKLETVTIIHGKGTGVLRSGIHTMLKSYKGIKGFRLGKYGEGETGVTIVEL